MAACFYDPVENYSSFHYKNNRILPAVLTSVEMRLSKLEAQRNNIWRECVGIEPTAEGSLLPPDLKSGRDTRPDPPP